MPRATFWTAAVLFAALTTPTTGSAQVPCEGDAGYDAAAIEMPCRDLRRILELTGEAPLQTSLLARGSDPRPFTREGSPAAEPESLLSAHVLPVRLRAVANSAYPSGGNDGLLWAGRGLSTSLEAGVGVQAGPFRAAISPAIAWQQNRAFDHPASTLPGSSPYANPFMTGIIDAPLRFGPDAFTSADLGASYARVDLFGFGAGVSNEPLWWGPGIRNSILLSNNAPGFPHLFVTTSRPLDIRIGKLDAQYVYGRLDESKWFDVDGGNDLRHFNAFAVAFSPAFAPGLSVGYSQLAHDRVRRRQPQEVLPEGFTPGNRLVGLYGRWAMPAARFELYGEWGHDDRWVDFLDRLMEPQHAQAYLVGLQKVLGSGNRRGRLHFELANTFEKQAQNAPRAAAIFYAHLFEIQGHTNRGQLLGAQIGPQALQQFLAVDLLTIGGFAGVFFERTVRNERYFYDVVSRIDGHDLELTAGLRELWSRGGVDLAWEAGVSRRWNAYFEGNRTNFRGSVSAIWRPDLAIRAR
ncbi:MAG TPA: capsule assembly Wzi family protein [Anaeromyxobacteraceae bacterium]|nr:capsule assembly Wzi family protein [Anaeromyxobacteraceae bacterium]